ncbi:MAG: hypothetical protein GW760_01290 [Legionella sp.]|jgi:hypothetical protein|nr:hypothetical protein [Legionella sp.]
MMRAQSHGSLNTSILEYEINLTFAETLHSKYCFSYCKEVCTSQLTNGVILPSDIRHAFTELLASSIAAEFREITAHLRTHITEGNNTSGATLGELYLSELNEFIQKYQPVIHARHRTHQVTQLEQGLLVMCEKQMNTVRNLIRPQSAPSVLPERTKPSEIDLALNPDGKVSGCMMGLHLFRLFRYRRPSPAKIHSEIERTATESPESIAVSHSPGPGPGNIL